MPELRILLVAYHFPPIAGSGVQRALKLAKYLPDNDIRVHVLTSGHTHYPLLDESLLEEVAGNPRVHIHRVCGFDPGGLAQRLIPGKRIRGIGRAASAIEQRVYWRLQAAADRFATPEPEQWWVGSAIRAARKLHGEFAFDAVVTTSPPHCCQRIGVELSRSLQIPWLADLRDPIVDNFAYAPKSASADRYWRQLERDIVKRSDAIVVTCPDYRELLPKKYRTNAERIACITNGYDEADRPEVGEPRKQETFTLGHVGALYQSQSIGPLLDACRALRSRRPEIPLRLRLVGSVSQRDALNFIESDAAFVERTGYRRHRDALAEMRDADALFLMTPTHANGRNCIPAKAFEYLAFGQHVIGLVHRRSSVESLLRSADDCGIAFHDAPEMLSDCIEAAYNAWRRGDRRDASVDRKVERYRRDQLASDFASLIRRTIDQSNPRHAGDPMESAAR